MSNPKRTWVIELRRDFYWTGFDTEGDPTGGPLEKATLFTETEARDQVPYIPLMVGVGCLVLRRLKRLKPVRELAEEWEEEAPLPVAKPTGEIRNREKDQVVRDFCKTRYTSGRETIRRGDTPAFLVWVEKELILTRRALRSACRHQLIVEALAMPEAEDLIKAYRDEDDQELVDRYMQKAIDGDGIPSKLK